MEYFSDLKLSPVFAQMLRDVIESKRHPVDVIIFSAKSEKDDRRALGKLTKFFRDHNCAGFSKEKPLVLTTFHPKMCMENIKKLYPEFAGMFPVMEQCMLIENIVISGLTGERLKLNHVLMLAPMVRNVKCIVNGKVNFDFITTLFRSLCIKVKTGTKILWSITDNFEYVSCGEYLLETDHKGDTKISMINISYDKLNNIVIIIIQYDGVDFKIVLDSDINLENAQDSPSYCNYSYVQGRVVTKKVKTIDVINKRIFMIPSQLLNEHAYEIIPLVDQGYQLVIKNK